jgi:flagellin
MAVINTNYKALFGQAALKGTERSLQTAMQQLSTGKRINSAKDDAAGMAISTRMTQQIRALDQSVRNAGDAISLIQTVEGATNAITDMMQRMRELAIQAINDTNANEQRSYLDLEFQQLKKEIVRISDMTEWNGFQVLNGSAGARVGDRPVYKTTSVGDDDTVFIDPTTSRTITGADAGEIQTLTFTDATADGIITVGGVKVTISATDVATDIGKKVLEALKHSTEFGIQSGHTVAAGATDDIIVINFDPASGDVSPVSFLDTDSTGASMSPVETKKAITGTEELFNGDFLHSGALNLTVSADGTVTASFLKNDGDTITMNGNYDAATMKLTFAKADNDTVITDDLVYRFIDATPAPTDISGREVKLAVDVSGSIPALQSGDLVINGVSIGASYPSDDLFSPANNASGSAIAIAAAINRKSKMTGVTAVVNENIKKGAPMSGAAVVKGNLVINGEATPTITTVLNNTRESRAAVVAAINFITPKTGVVAIDSESDAEGVRLVAVDGRNIELTFENLNASATDFSARTGLRQGVQAGTYALEAKVEQGVRIATSPNKDLSRARLSAGNYAENVSTQVTSLRDSVTDPDKIKTLKDGDLVINGFAVPASRAIDDKKSGTTVLTSSAASSAIAIAAAINKISGHTGVTATAYGATMVGNTASLVTSAGSKSLFINGKEFEIDMSDATTAGERVDQIVNLVNVQQGQTGVKAEKTIEGGLKLTTVDGRNLSVWYETGSDPRDFGLGVDGNEPAEGLSEIASPSADSTGAATVYGKVTLTSSKEFTIEPGVNGYKEDSNFTALGFLEGSFGGVVRDADGKMSPPRTGRLAFQVGASAGQLITIDLADFGKRGPITSAITGDVDDPLTITESASLTKTNVTSGLQSLYINSVEVKVLFGNDTPEQRRMKVAAAINDMRTEHGVQASDNGYGLTLTTIDGRNLSVWFDSNKVGNAEEFGLGGANGVTGEPGATATFGNAKVIYPASNHIRSGQAATDVLQKLDLAMDKVNANRANMGAVMNRLQYAMDNLRNVSMNSAASRSQIEDADYAAASTELAKSQIMQQAATSVLAQANMSQQTVLKLLGG